VGVGGYVSDYGRRRVVPYVPDRRAARARAIPGRGPRPGRRFATTR
jgi:hypothetical protein